MRLDGINRVCESHHVRPELGVDEPRRDGRDVELPLEARIVRLPRACVWGGEEGIGD